MLQDRGVDGRLLLAVKSLHSCSNVFVSVGSVKSQSCAVSVREKEYVKMRDHWSVCTYTCSVNMMASVGKSRSRDIFNNLYPAPAYTRCVHKRLLHITATKTLTREGFVVVQFCAIDRKPLSTSTLRKSWNINIHCDMSDLENALRCVLFAQTASNNLFCE